MNYGLFAGIGTLLCWTVGTLSFTEASQKAGAIAVNRVRLLYAAIFLLLISVFIPDFMQGVSLESCLWLGLSGIIGLSLGDYFAFSAYQWIGSTITSLFACFAPAAALLVGMVVLDEHLKSHQLFGMLVSALGVSFFLWRMRRDKKKIEGAKNIVWKALLFAFLGAVCQGVGLVFAKKGLSHGGMHPIVGTAVRMTIGTIAVYLIGILRRTALIDEFNRISFTKEFRTPVLRGVLFGPVMGVSLSLLAASLLAVSQAQTLFSLLPISVMGLNHLLGKERIKPEALIGAIIGILGVILLLS